MSITLDHTITADLPIADGPGYLVTARCTCGEEITAKGRTAEEAKRNTGLHLADIEVQEELAEARYLAEQPKPQQWHGDLC